uniref:helix-turn-helix domain-containing protein n=1 Tax=Phascolarctobacterium succinatutens TaxID=626940 RepID=UPI0023F75FF2
MTTIGDRIKARRLELDMSQDELARLVGYKSRSSINKIESDGRLLPQRKIMEIATALNTTPAYIMGWEESNQAEARSVHLSPREERLIAAARGKMLADGERKDGGAA